MERHVPLGFSFKHKNGFEISPDGAVARYDISRWKDFIWDTFVFSNRPVRVGEEVHLKLHLTKSACNGFGEVTVCFTNELPVTSSWRGKQLWHSPRSCRTNCIHLYSNKNDAYIKCYINDIGQVVYKINDEDEQKSAATINSSSAIWVIIWADGGTDNSITAEFIKPAVPRQILNVSDAVPQMLAQTKSEAGVSLDSNEEDIVNKLLGSQGDSLKSARMNKKVSADNETDVRTEPTVVVNDDCAHFSKILENLLREVPKANRAKCMIEILRITEEFKEINL